MELIVRGARVKGRIEPADIAFEGGRIAGVESRIDQPFEVELQADGRLASPACVEPHIHLDRTGVLASLAGNTTGTLARSLKLMRQAKREATVEGILERAKAAHPTLVTAGTTARATWTWT